MPGRMVRVRARVQRLLEGRENPYRAAAVEPLHEVLDPAFELADVHRVRVDLGRAGLEHDPSVRKAARAPADRADLPTPCSPTRITDRSGAPATRPELARNLGAAALDEHRPRGRVAFRASRTGPLAEVDELGKNMYPYKPQNGPWAMIAWDIDFSFGPDTSPREQSLLPTPRLAPFTNTSTSDGAAIGDALATKFRTQPAFRRAYWSGLSMRRMARWFLDYDARRKLVASALAASGITVNATQVDTVKTYNSTPAELHSRPAQCGLWSHHVRTQRQQHHH